MKMFQRFAGAALCAGLLFRLSACGKLIPAEQFSTQSSTDCSLSCHIELEEVRDGVTQSGVIQDFAADVQADLSAGTLQLSGTLDTLFPDGETGRTVVEAYGIRDETAGPVSYYRYGELYDTVYAENGYLDLVNLPALLEGKPLQKQKATAFVNDSECSLYTCTASAGDSGQLFLSTQAPGTVPLAGADFEATLAVYPGSGLPALLTLEFTGLEEQPLTYTGSDGSLHPITALTVEVTYFSYGNPLQIQVPEGFGAEPVEYSQDAGADIGGAVTGSGESYIISNDDGSCSYEIQVPEQMVLNNAEYDCVSFYRYYNEVDLESMEYSIFNDFSNEEELQYAAYLPEYYAADKTSEVTASEIQTVNLNGWEVQYLALYSTAELDGNQYMHVYSWHPAAEDGSDSLEVQIYNYVVSGDPPLDPETELIRAYGCILGRAAQ